MRVIAGSARGRRLKAPRGTATRPTPDRVREAMFSTLARVVPGAVVLDLFAGTGALGIEALSRGADHATFVEREARVAEVLVHNLRRAGVEDRARVVRADAAGVVREHAGAPYTLVFCDPPYATALEPVLALVDTLDRRGGLAAGATVVVERDRRDPAVAELGDRHDRLAVRGRRSYGDTVVVYLVSGDD